RTVAIRTAPVLEKNSDGIGETESVLAHQPHDEGRRRDHFRERRQIEWGVVVGLERFAPQGPAGRTDVHGRGWKDSSFDGAVDHLAREIVGQVGRAELELRVQELTAMPTAMQIAVPATTYHVQASGEKRLMAIMAASDDAIPA